MIADSQPPVAFLVFNRPDCTRRVFAAIRAARPSKLLVVADGPRAGHPTDDADCRAVRTIIEDGVDWDCEVLTHFSPTNLGCRQRVASGLDWVFAQVEQAIILEDDCLPAPEFFVFCARMLERFREDDRVLMIGGTNYLLNEMQLPESYFFSRYFAIWGWATWRRAWRLYNRQMDGWPAMRDAGGLRGFYPQEFMVNYMSRLFDTGVQPGCNTWDIQWFYTCLTNKGLSIVPRVNLISNIGLVGTHTSDDHSNHNFPVFPFDAVNLVHPSLVAPHPDYDAAFYERKLKPVTRLDRWRNRLGRWRAKLAG